MAAMGLAWQASLTPLRAQPAVGPAPQPFETPLLDYTIAAKPFPRFYLPYQPRFVPGPNLSNAA